MSYTKLEASPGIMRRMIASSLSVFGDRLFAFEALSTAQVTKSMRGHLNG